MSDTTLNSFPANRLEALALLYVQSQDLTNSTPEELLDMYDDAYAKMKEHSRDKKAAKKSNWTY